MPLGLVSDALLVPVKLVAEADVVDVGGPEVLEEADGETAGVEVAVAVLLAVSLPCSFKGSPERRDLPSK